MRKTKKGKTKKDIKKIERQAQRRKEQAGKEGNKRDARMIYMQHNTLRQTREGESQENRQPDKMSDSGMECERARGDERKRGKKSSVSEKEREGAREAK